MQTDWQVQIQDRPAMMLVDIFIFRVGHDEKTISWNVDGEKNTVTEKTYEPHEYFPPSFTLPRPLLKLLMKAIMERGVKSEEQSFVQGELQATKGHLSDLRQLLKIKDKDIGTPQK